jgi:two-component system, OmpR family, response regulator PhoP
MKDSRGKDGQRVVVVEDDDELRDRVLVPGLRSFGFDASGVGSAAELYRLVDEDPPPLIVLDVVLPDEDGFKVAQRLRAASAVGIVMLTGLDSNADRIRGLQGGADVFLTKPIDMEVLAASLHSLARRIQGVGGAKSASSAMLEWRLEGGGWRLLAPNGEVVALSMSERLILDRLAASPEQPVAREVLINDLSAHIDDFDPGRLEMLIHRLRRKVVARSGHELPLTAIRRIGYLLAFK